MSYILSDENYEKLREWWDKNWLAIDNGLDIDEMDIILDSMEQIEEEE